MDVVWTHNLKGSIYFQNLPEKFEIRATDGSKITSNIPVGQEFYLYFDGEEKPELKEELIVEHSYKKVKFYFYEYKSGGSTDKSTQNLIRLQPTDNVSKASLKVTFDGVVDKEPAPPDTPDPTPKTGNLTVSKTVSGNAGDKQKEFHFTVTLGDQTISGSFGGMTFTDGVVTFTLKDGEHKTAEGLQTGITYTVTEAEDGQDGYTTDKTGNTGTIEADKTEAAVFTNIKTSNDIPTDPTVPEPPTDPTPQTGDETNLTLWLSLLGISTVGIITALTTAKPAYKGKRCKR